MFATGVTVGLVVGAAAALLFAPQAGAVTRAALRSQARRLGLRSTDAWEELRQELRLAARRGRRSMREMVDRGRGARMRARGAAIATGLAD